MAGRRALVDLVRRLPVVRRLAAAVRARRGAAVLRGSGLVDERWYRQQVEPDEVVGDVVDHYLRVGAARGLTPHPLFDPETYLAASATARRSAAAPYVEFLDVGCHRAHPPHPLFDPRAYVAAMPAAVEHPHGPFGHFCDSQRAPVPLPAGPAALVRPGGQRDGTAGGVVPGDWGRRAAAALQAARPPAPVPPGQTTTFDTAAAERFAASVRAGTANRRAPLVTVVLPTRNRRALVAEAIASVRAQTWESWELVVVDDGGDDGTDALVTEIAAADARVRYVRQPHGGVAAARNKGIAEGSGEYVAYLDSDNTWEPAFLEVMLGVLLDGPHRAAYCVSELHDGSQVRHRAATFDRRALLARNHIDCIVLVHERALLDEVGTFDEGLERFVDWDLLLRLAAVTDLHHVPFVGTRYAVGEAATHDRITTTRSLGWRDVVQARHLVDWEGAPAPQAGTMSAVLVADGELPTAAMANLLGLAADPDALGEVVVVALGLSRGDLAVLHLANAAHGGLRVVVPPVPTTSAVGRCLGVASACGDVVVLLESEARPSGPALARLAGHVRDGAGVVAPLLLGPAGTVVGSAVTLLGSGDVVRWGIDAPPDDEAATGPAPGAPDPPTRGLVPAEAVQQGVVAVGAATLRELRGPDPLFMDGLGVVDLALRAGGGAVATDVEVVWTGDPERVGGTPHARDRAALARRWRTPPAAAGSLRAGLRARHDPGGGVPRRWDAVPTRSGRRRWAIATCVPERAGAEAWGDWHFAHGLRDALVALGEHAVVDTVASRGRVGLEREDIHVLLRGVNPVPAVPGAVNLLWVISHPADVEDTELWTADHVFAAGPDLADRFAARRDDGAVSTLLQCTDPARFAPPATVADGPELLFVGNSRGRARPVLEHARAAGLAPTVIGGGWDGLVPAEWIAAEHVPNDELAALYAGAGVVLNDHWDDMRAAGIVSNRLFDVVAAGGVAVSDPVDGLADLFGERVITYHGPDDLPAAIARAAAVGRDDHLPARVRGEHSFAARARTLIATADRLAAAVPPGR